MLAELVKSAKVEQVSARRVSSSTIATWKHGSGSGSRSPIPVNSRTKMLVHTRIVDGSALCQNDWVSRHSGESAAEELSNGGKIAEVGLDLPSPSVMPYLVELLARLERHGKRRQVVLQMSSCFSRGTLQELEGMLGRVPGKAHFNACPPIRNVRDNQKGEQV